ncbi:TPA: DUF5462 family protein [Citrobacter werkmanii]|nr:DUF5462 family protein [Citrobacter werkmanii]
MRSGVFTMNRMTLLTLLLLVCLPPAIRAQQVSEQRFPLGFVNGKIRNNQTVEVLRPLPRSELLEAIADGTTPLPGILQIDQVTGALRGDGQVNLHLRHPRGTSLTEAFLTVRLMVDGQPVPARLLSTEPVTLAVPPARQRVSLVVTEPVRLWLPRDSVGEFELDMEVTAWPAEEAPEETEIKPDSLPLTPLSPATPDTASLSALLHGGGVFQG